MMELTRALGQLAKEGMRPAPHPRRLQLGRRRSRPHRFHRVGRAIRRRTSRQSRRLHQRRRSHLRPELPRTGRRLARAHAGRNHPHACKIRQEKVSTTHGRQPSPARKRKATQSSQFNSSGIIDDSLADTRIGSGCDHTVFLNFIGMPVLGLGFDGDYGVYHSAYDDFYWMNHFGDPGYKYHTLMSPAVGSHGPAPRQRRPAPLRLRQLRQQHPPVRERTCQQE